MLVWFATLGPARPRPDRAEPGRARRPRPALRRGPVRASPAGRPSWPWVRSCSPSPGPRRSTPTWAISAAAPIRLAWFGLVLPGLVLNYFGQGALVLRDPAALEHPFYHLVPGWALWPLIGLATCATIIASQAVISGVFSLTRQAIQLGYLPRMTVRHTSATEIGQIYIPRVNWLLMVGRAAAGVRLPAPRATSPPPTASRSPAPWRSTPCWPAWSPPGAGAGGRPRRWSSAFFLLIDLAYFAANALKIPSGGWFPLAVAAAFAYLVVTWRRGRRVLWDKLYGRAARRRGLHRRARPGADPGPRHGGVHDRQPRRRADGAAAQHQAQPGPARAGRADDRAHRRTSRTSRRSSGSRSRRSAQASSGSS